MYSVYGLYSELYPDDIRYIGITKQKVSVRLRQHLLRSNSLKGRKSNWIKYFKSINVEIKIKTLDTDLTLEQACLLEIFYMNYHKENSKQELLNVYEGGDVPTPKLVPIVCLDLKGNFIKEYDSVKQASKETTVKDGNIISICKKVRAGRKFIFVYKKDYLENEDYSNRSYSKKLNKILIERHKNKDFKKNISEKAMKKIDKIDLNGNLITTFNSIFETINVEKISPYILNKCLKSNRIYNEHYYNLTK